MLDWGLFVERLTDKIDWAWLEHVLEKFKMTDFANCMNSICVGELGFEPSIFQKVQFNPFLKDRVLQEILEPSFKREEPRGLFPRLAYKYRRWQGNAWKQELCYQDSRCKSFWNGVWSHLLKPRSI